MTTASLRRRTYEVLEGTRQRDRLSQTVQWFLIVLIVLNVAAVILNTAAPLRQHYGTLFQWFLYFSIAVFTVEYVLRVWACIEDERFAGRPVVGRLRFMITPAAIIDLLAILPFYLPRVLGAVDLRAIRAVRLFRLLRLLKLGRFSQAVSIFTRVLKNKKEQLAIAAITVTILLVFASSLMYVAEHRAQPQHFSSIPAAMWWAVITLTTVGYGDVTPVTTLGRFAGGFIAVLGIGLFALPAGILSSGFEEALDEYNSDESDDEKSDDEKSDDEENGESKKDEEKSRARDDDDGDEHASEEHASDEHDRTADPGAPPPKRYCPHCGERLYD